VNVMTIGGNVYLKRVPNGVRLVQGGNVVVLSRRFVAGIPDALAGNEREVERALERLAEETTQPTVSVSSTAGERVILMQGDDVVLVGLHGFLAALRYDGVLLTRPNAKVGLVKLFVYGAGSLS
jgi:hypothetical protein